jgi:hypothetical protein
MSDPQELAFPGTITVDYVIGQAKDGKPITQPKPVQVPGLTKAEWFAGMALQGILAAGLDRDLGYAELAAHAFAAGLAMADLSRRIGV